MRKRAIRNQTMSVVAIIGASEKPDRYANRAQRMLMEAGHSVLPVSPRGDSVLGVAGYASLDAIPGGVDTVTLYIGSDRVPAIADQLLAKRPRRVIFNPGTENETVRARLEAAGIETVEGCTLVMLRTGQF